MRPAALALFCSRLNQAVQQRQLVFTVPYSLAVVNFLFSLKQNRLVAAYTVLTLRMQPSAIYVKLLYFHNLPIFSRLFIYSKRKQFVYFSRNTLTKFQDTRKSQMFPIFFLQTAQGIQTQFQALAIRQGGRVFACIQ